MPTLRIHRGNASSHRVVMLGKKELGRLEEEVNDFEVPIGSHVVELALGNFHGMPTKFRIHEGEVLEFRAVEDPDAILPIFLSGTIKLKKVTHPPVLHD